MKDLLFFFRICKELWCGFRFLRKTKRGVTIFGSARLPDSHPACKLAHDLAHALAQKGFPILTGGGPSIMQAANQGAHSAGGVSIGINIKLPREPHLNPFVTASIDCHYFFVRKVLLARYSDAFIGLAGGFGTLDELLEIITLIQTGKMNDRPVILVGREFWKGFLDWCRTTLITEGTISETEFARIKVCDTVEEVLLEIGIR